MTATCPHCGDALDVPDEFAGRPVRCGACGSVFTPADAPPEPPVPIARPARPARPLPPPEPPVPPPRRNNFAVWGLLALTFLVVAPCTGVGVWTAITMMFPTFVPVADAGGRFSAAFPGPETPTPVNGSNDDGVPVRGLELTRQLPPESFFVVYLDLPPALAKKPAKEVLEAAADALTGRVPAGAKEVAREDATHDGHEALDLKYRDGPGEMIVRCVLVPGKGRPARVYVAGWAGPANNARDAGPGDLRVRRFFTEFRIDGP